MIGELDQRAALESAVLAPDGAGGYTESWQIFAHAWVKITPANATDASSADAPQSRARHRITLRRRNDLAAGQRLTTSSRRFKVHGVLDEGPRTALVTLLCEELP